MARQSNDDPEEQQMAKMDYINTHPVPEQCTSCPYTNLPGTEIDHASKSPPLHLTQNSTLCNVHPLPQNSPKSEQNQNFKVDLKTHPQKTQ